jgi:hypothetical protein
MGYHSLGIFRELVDMNHAMINHYFSDGIVQPCRIQQLQGWKCQQQNIWFVLLNRMSLINRSNSH